MDRFEYPQPPPQYTATAPVFQPSTYFLPQQPTAIIQPNFIITQPSVPAAPPDGIVTEQPRRTIVHVYQNTVLGSRPTMIICLNCARSVLTEMKYEANTTTHLMALGLCVFGLIPCSVLPYLINSCQTGNHYCPSCGIYIGTYKRD